MLHITYRLDQSPLHGIGVFTEEDIPKDFCIVEASPALDINLTEEEFFKLSQPEQDEIRHHGHFDKISGKWHVDFDMTRFANHSDTPNIEQRYNERGYYIVARRAIEKGEELTINYADFEAMENSLARGLPVPMS